MSKFMFDAGDMIHQIELPYLVSLETAKQWLSTLRHLSSDELEAEKAKRKAEWTKNNVIIEQERHQSDKDRFDTAIKVSESEYEGYVFIDDEYYSDIDEYRGCCCCDLSSYVWACKPVKISTWDASELLSESFENRYEDAWEDVPEEAIAKLNKALEKFYEATKHINGWEADYSKAVILMEAEE